VWTLLKICSEDEDFNSFLENSEFKLSKETTKKTTQGEKIYFYCSFKGCQHQIYALKVSTSQEIHLYFYSPHTHTQIPFSNSAP